MSSHPAPAVARLIELLSTIACDGSTGRLLLSAAQGEAAGSLTFEEGKLKSIHPPRGAHWKQSDHRDRQSVCREVAALASQACAPDAAFAAVKHEPGPPHKGLGAGDLAMALAAHLTDEAWLKSTLLDGPDRRLRGGLKPPVCPPADTSGTAAFLIGKTGAISALRQIVTTAPDGTLAALQTLFVLNAIGLVRVEEVHDTTPAATQNKPNAALAAADRFLGRTKQQQQAATAAARAPKSNADVVRPRRQIIERVRGEGDKSERDQLIERCDAIKGQDHYSILEASRKATEDEIRHAYYKLARLYHPDKVRKPHLHDMLPRLEAMFAAITEAYNTLTNAAARAEYDRILVEKEAGHKAPDIREQQAQARDLFIRGRKQLEARQVFEALRFFEAAVQADATRAEYWHHLGACQARNPRWRKRAEESLMKAIKMNPGSVESYRELARMYKRGGLNDRAATMYRKVLEWDPENKEALDAVHSGGGGDDKGGGLFGSLFGSKA